MPDEDPLLRYGGALAGVIIAVVLSVMVAAMAAAQFGDTYEVRGVIYTGFVLWILVGSVVMFMLAHRGEASRLSVSRVLLWCASIWLWPVFAILHWRRREQ